MFFKEALLFIICLIWIPVGFEAKRAGFGIGLVGQIECGIRLVCARQDLVSGWCVSNRIWYRVDVYRIGFGISFTCQIGTGIS